MKLVENLREEGIEAYYTIDTGANMHVLSLPETEKEIIKILKEKINLKQVISSKPGSGVRKSNEHLF